MEFVYFTQLLIILLSFIDGTCGKHKQFFYSNAVQITNDKYIDSVPLSEACESSNRESPCGITPVVKVNLTEDLNGPIVYLRVYELSTNKTLIKQTLNVCSMTKQPGLNIFVRFVSEQLKESTNFKFECPVRKDYYEVKSFPISPRFDLLLNFFPLNKQHNAIAVVKNSFSGKLMETVYSYSVDLEVVEVA